MHTRMHERYQQCATHMRAIQKRMCGRWTYASARAVGYIVVLCVAWRQSERAACGPFVMEVSTLIIAGMGAKILRNKSRIFVRAS
jgi:hypothetical protein